MQRKWSLQERGPHGIYYVVGVAAFGWHPYCTLTQSCSYTVSWPFIIITFGAPSESVSHFRLMLLLWRHQNNCRHVACRFGLLWPQAAPSTWKASLPTGAITRTFPVHWHHVTNPHNNYKRTVKSLHVCLEVMYLCTHTGQTAVFSSN